MSRIAFKMADRAGISSTSEHRDRAMVGDVHHLHAARSYFVKRRLIWLISIASTAVSIVNLIAQDDIERKPLLKVEIGPQTISTVDIREITFQPLQQTGRHRHPCPVISYIVAGTIGFQIEGQQMRTLHAGEVCYEPANTVIEHFDNLSDKEPAKFVPSYLLNGQKELIELLPAK